MGPSQSTRKPLVILNFKRVWAAISSAFSHGAPCFFSLLLGIAPKSSSLDWHTRSLSLCSRSLVSCLTFSELSGSTQAFWKKSGKNLLPSDFYVYIDKGVMAGNFSLKDKQTNVCVCFYVFNTSLPMDRGLIYGTQSWRCNQTSKQAPEQWQYSAFSAASLQTRIFYPFYETWLLASNF